MENFIATLAPYAMKHGKARNILPSLIIAQGILETGGGKSELAREANNLFGIKKGMGWDGPVHSVVTGEYRKNAEGEDEYYEIVAEFRKYDSYEGAVIDLCDKYNTMPRYAAVPFNYNFVSVTQAVKDAGYATDPIYPTKLQNIYELHGLDRYDAEFGEIIKEDTDMVLKVVVDAGHGRYTPGKRSPADEREWLFNNVVAVALIAELKKYAGVQVLRVDDPTGKTDVPLSTRTSRANAFGGDVYVSIHHNAFRGVWGTHTGTETFVYSTTTTSDGSWKLAQAVHPRLVSAMGLANRGIKKANFAVLRETRMPAILTEGGYMDSTIDIRRMRDNGVLRNAGVKIAEGVAAYGNLKKSVAPVSNPKPTTPTAPKPDKLFRVRKLWSQPETQIGAYSVLESAKEVADKNILYNVYNSSGEVVYDPRKARDEALAKAKREAEEAAKKAEEARKKAEAEEKAKREAEAEAARKEEARKKAEEIAKASNLAILDNVIVMNSERDYAAARLIHLATGYPMFEREALYGRLIARHIIGVGGTDEELKETHGDEVTMVSGKTAQDTADKVQAFIDNL